MSNRRYSLPSFSNKENQSPSSGSGSGSGARFKFKTYKPNRRHTLLPIRSILKVPLSAQSDTNEAEEEETTTRIGGDRTNNTIAFLPKSKPTTAGGEKRRVSFAPDVTLHKISLYHTPKHAKLSRSVTPPVSSGSGERTRRDSLSLPSLKRTGSGDGDSDLDSSSDEDFPVLRNQRIPGTPRRGGFATGVTTTGLNGVQEEGDDGDVTSDDEADKEHSQPISHLLNSIYDADDNTTQTISMELTDQINRQQAEISDQLSQSQNEPAAGDESGAVKESQQDDDTERVRVASMFAGFEDDDDGDDTQEKTIEKSRAEADVDGDVSMELTKPFGNIAINEKTENLTEHITTGMDLTEWKKPESTSVSDTQTKNVEDDDDDDGDDAVPMEFTQPVQTKQPTLQSNTDNDDQTAPMEFTQPVRIVNTQDKNTEEEEDQTTPMEFTQPVQTTRASGNEENDNDNDNTVPMEFTQPVTVRPDTDADVSEEQTMQFTQTIPHTSINTSEDIQLEEEAEVPMDFTQPMSKPVESETISHVQQEWDNGSRESMDFTPRFRPSALSDINEDDESLVTQTMDFTQFRPIAGKEPITLNSEEDLQLEEVEEQPMDLTQTVRKVMSPPPLPTENQNKLPNTPSPSLKRIRTDVDGSPPDSTKAKKKLQLEPVKARSIAEMLQRNVGSTPAPKNANDDKENKIVDTTTATTTAAINVVQTRREATAVLHSDPADVSLNSSYVVESNVSTEMIPLAEVTINEVGGGDDYDDDEDEDDFDDEDDDYVNVSLQTFLNNINVEFFYSLGATETKLRVDKYHTNNNPSVMDFITAVNSIPDYNYLVHLINQYKSNIAEIRSDVSNFESEVEENNPKWIREYFEQNDDIRKELNIKFQTMSFYAKKQAENENLNFLSNLKGQLVQTHQARKLEVDAEFKRVALDRKQHLLKNKETLAKIDEIKQKLGKLSVHKTDFDSVDRGKLEFMKSQLVKLSQKNKELKLKINEKQAEVDKIQDAINTKTQQVGTLNDDIKQLDHEIQRVKLPGVEDIRQLRDKLTALETQLNLKITQLDSKIFKLCICNEIEISIDLLNHNSNQNQTHSHPHSAGPTPTAIKPTLKFNFDDSTSFLNKGIKKHPELLFLYQKFIDSLNQIEFGNDECESQSQSGSQSGSESLSLNLNLYGYVREICLRYRNFQNLLHDILMFKLFYQLKVVVVEEVSNVDNGKGKSGSERKREMLCWTYYKKHEFKFSFVVGVDELMAGFGGCHRASINDNDDNNNNGNNDNGSNKNSSNVVDVKVNQFKFVDFVNSRGGKGKGKGTKDEADEEEEEEEEEEKVKVRSVFEEMLDRVDGLNVLNRVVF
ncbi:unnamed protein product [Ambrosiozyma monospora]|uniref:Unnamed protein product n=1 Tax=Ambrosiozyma monospora TaxID=43982 RepID=A0A9W6YY48_AMBMO|nr:unnamed protein product [Ambrosiozyma monospora]